MWGKRDAPVTIVDFSDFQCPFCSRVEPTIDQVEDDVRPGQGPRRLEEQPAALPPQREAGGRGRAGRLRSRRQRRVLEVPRHRVQEPERARHRQLREVGAGRGRQGHRGVQGRPRQPQVGRQGRQGSERRQGRRRPRHARLLRQRRVPHRRAAVRQVQEDDRPGARRRPRRRSPPARRRTSVYVAMSQGEQDQRSRRRRRQEGRGAEGRHDHGLQGARRQQPGARQPERARHHRRVLRLPVPVLQARRADRSRRSTTSTATRSASSGRTSPCRSTTAPSRPPRWPWKRAPRRATRASGTCTTSCSTTRRPRPTTTSWATACRPALNADKVKDAIANHKYKKEIDADNDLGEDLQASGTPHFFINGRRLVGALAVREVQRRSSTRRSPRPRP